MTFVGSMPASLRSIVKEPPAPWPVADAYIGCSGNFTIERTLRALDPGWRLHGNDVSIFTTAIGNWLAGRRVELSLTGEWESELDWIAPYLDGGVGSVATLQLLTHFAPDLRIDHPWRVRNVVAHRRDFGRLHRETVSKLETNHFDLASFRCMDVRDWLDFEVPDDATVLSFPPFDVGGYEKLYARLDEIFDWPRPTYTVMTQEGIEALVQKITDRPRWLMGVLDRLDYLDDHLVGYVRETATARPFYVYAKGGTQRTRFVVPRARAEAVTADRIWPGDEIGDRMTLAPLSVAEFVALRAKYLNAGIATGTGNIHYPHAVLVDGKIIGVVAYGMMWTPGHLNEILLVADFAVAPHDYPKLSKLVVMAAVSTEFQRVVERGFARRVRYVNTAVYSNNPVSMKYRGVFDLVERGDPPKGSPFKHKLAYRSAAGRWTLDEALAIWKQKWGQRATREKETT